MVNPQHEVSHFQRVFSELQNALEHAYQLKKRVSHDVPEVVSRLIKEFEKVVDDADRHHRSHNEYWRTRSRDFDDVRKVIRENVDNIKGNIAHWEPQSATQRSEHIHSALIELNKSWLTLMVSKAHDDDRNVHHIRDKGQGCLIAMLKIIVGEEQLMKFPGLQGI